MPEQNNATCAICGRPYRVCRTCLEIKSFKPWRTVTDTIEHYGIYLDIHDYTVTGDKDAARKALQNRNLDGKEQFLPEIRKVIDEIMDNSSKDIKPARDKVNSNGTKKIVGKNVHSNDTVADKNNSDEKSDNT